jgi:glycosyltransferase involved in cell wall biosynthesis
MPRVSIITATYNRSDVLRWAIESVLGQTYQDWEHIIVGDHCTDDTADVVASFNDPRIRFVNRETNFGEQTGPNNDGFALSSGQLIAYLNQDDLWFPDHLESLIRHMTLTSADLVYALPFDVDQNGLPYCGLTNAELNYDPTHFVVASLWLAKRDLITDVGGWHAATQINAITPSQDLLTRAWQRGKVMRCHPRITALWLAAGGRPRSFILRDSSQHEAMLAQIRTDPGLRERLLTDLAMRVAREDYMRSFESQGTSGRLNYLANRLLVRLHLRPDSVRNWLSRRPKGWWVDVARSTGGLRPLPRPGEKTRHGPPTERPNP